jgi:hypothetical protein
MKKINKNKIGLYFPHECGSIKPSNNNPIEIISSMGLFKSFL